MNIVKLLLLANIALTFCLITKKCIKNKKIIINHYFCFSLGYLYYGIIPFFCYTFNIYFDDYIYNVLLMKYKDIDIKNKVLYLLISGVLYLCFIFGGKNRKKVRHIYLSHEKTRLAFSEQLFFLPVMTLGIIFLWHNKDFLFIGYKGQSVHKGELSGYVAMLMTLLLMNILSKKNMKFFSEIKCKWGYSYIIFAILLLTMGGRLYVVTSLFALLICYTNFYSSGISIGRFIQIMAVIMMSVGTIGLMRLGQVLNINKMFFNILQEPIYGSYPLITYLQNNNIEKAWNLPLMTLSGMVNLIPYSIFPAKTSYMIDISALSKGVEAPLGGTHYFVQYILDYGYCGSILIFLLLGKFMSFLEIKRDSYLCKTIYCMMTAGLTFTFFRDAISISLIKNIFQGSILIPCIIWEINKLLENSTYKGKCLS